MNPLKEGDYMQLFLKMLGMVQKTRFRHLFFWAGGLLFLSAFVMRLLEPDTFPTVFDSFWYVMTTVTTVGYGDYSPETTGGRLFAITFLYLLGIGILGMVIGKIVQVFSLYQQYKEEGKLSYHKKGHYIFIGWCEEKSKEAISSVLFDYPEAEIVLIDTLEKCPIVHERLHYIQGNLTEESTLDKANIRHCRRISIFSPSHIQDSTLADGHTLLIAASIEAFSVKHGIELHTIAEMRKESHRASFEKANIDEIVLSTESIARMMAKAAVVEGSNQLFFQLLNDQAGHDLRQIRPENLWATYGEVNEWLEQRGANLISDRGDMSIIQKRNDRIPDSACLLFACDDDHYEQILTEIKKMKTLLP